MDVAEYGQGDTKPDRNGMGESGQVNVKQQETHPSVTIFLWGQGVSWILDIKVYSVGQVCCHSYNIEKGYPCQYSVDRCMHVLSAQNRDVNDVCWYSETADDQAQASMPFPVPFAVLFERKGHYL